MSKLSKGDKLELADGKTYYCVAVAEIDGHEYDFLSPKGEDEFIVGEVKETDGKRSFKVIQDENVVKNIQKYFDEHPEEIEKL